MLLQCRYDGDPWRLRRFAIRCFSNSRQRCVFIDGHRGDDGVAGAAVAAGIIGAIIGGAASSNDGYRNSNGGQHNSGGPRPGGNQGNGRNH